MKALGMALALGLLGVPANAQDVLLRADLPLWTDSGDPDLFPQHFFDGDSFGCVSNVPFGDYRFIEMGEEEPSRWWRLANYGVFHCALILSRAAEQRGLDHGFNDYAWLIVLGEAETATGVVQLLALQEGVRGGSTYTLLSRPKGDDLLHPPISVLDPACPRGSVRRAPDDLDIWITSYCVVTSQSDLRRIARTAVRRPPAAVLHHVDEARGQNP